MGYNFLLQDICVQKIGFSVLLQNQFGNYNRQRHVHGTRAETNLDLGNHSNTDTTDFCFPKKLQYMCARCFLFPKSRYRADLTSDKMSYQWRSKNFSPQNIFKINLLTMQWTFFQEKMIKIIFFAMQLYSLDPTTSWKCLLSLTCNITYAYSVTTIIATKLKRLIHLKVLNGTWLLLCLGFMEKCFPCYEVYLKMRAAANFYNLF